MAKSKKETKSEAAARRARELNARRTARRAGRPGGKELNTGPNSEPRPVRSGTEDTEHDPQGYNEAMGADEYRKKGIYVTDSNHHGKDSGNVGDGKAYGDPDKGQHGHDCERVHPGKSHKAWEILNSTHDGGPAGGHEPGIKKNYESVSNENTNVLKFIGSISKKNYAEANKYLQLALEDKLKRRIASTANKTEF
jgi:hypothetical protein